MSKAQVLVIGGGFAGLAAVKRLSGRGVDVTLIDKANHHLFQPLLYQVATGGLSPANIAAPLRSVFRSKQDVTVIKDDIQSIDLADRVAHGRRGQYRYDTLILAAGGEISYFGHDEWRQAAPGLKSIADATAIRERVLSALELAESTRGERLPTFVLAGGGPTGVEMAGAIAELTRQTLKGEFRHIDPAECKILIADPGDRLLAGYPEKLSDRAADQLRSMGCEVCLGAALLDVGEDFAVIGDDEHQRRIPNAVTVWAAGVSAVKLTRTLAGQFGAELQHGGRLPVEKDLRLPGVADAFAVGDLASFYDQDGDPLPGVAPVAIQQGRHAAMNALRLAKGKPTKPFKYRDYGSMAVIGRGAAVADVGGWQLGGYPAWLAWLFIHLIQLVGFQNRLLVATQWAWNYFTRNREARLITARRDS
ncbi:NAD(P)/FAD-dependent oxidoreductase [Botrimarina sp.]|uniref:NAD(P)/FAD-dependent oxidoreductase n=1 Tax=Botrimarina sp. TaxID=2795802 RepID=UPI0032EBC0F6